MNKLLDPVTRFLATVTSNPISLVGSGLTTVAAFLFLLLFSIHLVSEHGGSPYLGILTFLILPAVFVFGLVLIPIGLWQVRKRRRQALAAVIGVPLQVIAYRSGRSMTIHSGCGTEPWMVKRYVTSSPGEI